MRQPLRSAPYVRLRVRVIVDEGIIDFELASPAGLNLGISCTIGSLTTANFKYTLTLFDGTTINSLKTSYFSYDYSVHTYLSSSLNVATYGSGDQVYSGTGYR